MSDIVKWEYKTHLQRNTDVALSDYSLSQMGAEGWELAAVWDDGRNVHYVFKRVWLEPKGVSHD